MPDYTWFWWKLRPHPRLGTVEIRALDAQASLPYMAALVALVHCLARDAAEAGPGVDPPAELLEEGIFRAARFGVDGRATRTRRAPAPGHRAAASTRSPAGPACRRAGCAEELAGLPELLARGGGAGFQRAANAIAGIDAVGRQLTELTSAQRGLLALHL